MGLLENLPENSRPRESASADDLLKGVTQDLQHLRHDLVSQLTHDIGRLQSEKTQLIDEITQLREEQQLLKSQQQITLSQQQIAQQQVWAKQLAQVLAGHLRTLLIQQAQQNGQIVPTQSTRQLAIKAPGNGPLTSPDHIVSSIDSSLNHTLSVLQRDLDSYQSALSQQIGRMQNLEQQGEAILNALVSRLNEQLQVETVRSQTYRGQSPMNGHGTQVAVSAQNGTARPAAYSSPTGGSRTSSLSDMGSVAPISTPGVSTPSRRQPETRRINLTQFQMGLVLILLSTIALSLHNVVVGIIGNESSILGLFQLGGYLRLGLGNALLILLLRMLIVIPLMFGIASSLYPPVWKEIKAFLTSRDRRLLLTVVASGGFLFLSQVLIYIAIAEVGPGVAVTILFMYPLVTVPLAWFFFKDRPTLTRWLIMAAISVGIIFTASPNNIFVPDNGNISGAGVAFATFSGIAFACYLIFMQICFKKLHPVPVSLVQFSTIGVFSAVSLILLPSFPLPDRWNAQVAIDRPGGFLVLGVVLGVLTLIGYLANNFGVRFMGAARAAIIASSGPALTALLAFLITPGPRTQLQSGQAFGILMVTLGVIGLSMERMLMQRRALKKRSPAGK